MPEPLEGGRERWTMSYDPNGPTFVEMPEEQPPPTPAEEAPPELHFPGFTPIRGVGPPIVEIPTEPAPEVSTSEESIASLRWAIKVVRALRRGYYGDRDSVTIRNLTDDLSLSDKERLIEINDKHEHAYRSPLTICHHCEKLTWTWGVDEINDEFYCDPCRDTLFTRCVACENYQSNTDADWNIVDGEPVCDSCLRSHYYCEQCEEYSVNPHRHECECDAPRLRFEFPANGLGTLRENVPYIFRTPEGTIPEEGLREVASAVRGAMLSERERIIADYPWVPEKEHTQALYLNVARDIHALVEDLDARWQTKEGNFTKRLSKLIFREYKIKLAPPLVSSIGNIARQHAAKTSEFIIELTRDLNLSAEEFYHDGSCWWLESHAHSRCFFKQHGGIGMRSWDDESGSAHRASPRGRAWILPLHPQEHVNRYLYDPPRTATRLTPLETSLPSDIPEKIEAPAYFVFNGYGNLDGFTPARIVAHMTGLSYRKVNASCSEDTMWVNQRDRANNRIPAFGFLVADQETCNATDSIIIPHWRKH